MKKFLYDITRDKGSQKFSITKTLAFASFLFLITYLSYYLIWLEKDVDHTLLLELIGFISALVGMKNNWGVKSKDGTITEMDVFVEPKKDDTVDDAEF